MRLLEHARRPRRPRPSSVALGEPAERRLHPLGRLQEALALRVLAQGARGCPAPCRRRARGGRLRAWVRHRVRSSRAFIVDIVPRRLPETQAKGQGLGQGRPQLAPADQGDVLGAWGSGRGTTSTSRFRFLWSRCRSSALLGELLQLVQVEDVSGVGIDLAFDRELELVVVTVVVRIVAWSEHLLIPLLGKFRVVHPMGRVEVDLAGDARSGHGREDGRVRGVPQQKKRRPPVGDRRLSTATKRIIEAQ